MPILLIAAFTEQKLFRLSTPVAILKYFAQGGYLFYGPLPRNNSLLSELFFRLRLLVFWDCCLLQLHTWDTEGKCQLRDLTTISFLGVKVSCHSAFLSLPFRIFLGLFLSRVQYFQLYLMEWIDKSTSSISFRKEAPKFTFNLSTYLETMYAMLF